MKDNKNLKETVEIMWYGIDPVIRDCIRSVETSGLGRWQLGMPNGETYCSMSKAFCPLQYGPESDVLQHCNWNEYVMECLYKK